MVDPMKSNSRIFRPGYILLFYISFLHFLFFPRFPPRSEFYIFPVQCCRILPLQFSATFVSYQRAILWRKIFLLCQWRCYSVMSLAYIHLHFFVSFSDLFTHSFLTHIHYFVISSYICTRFRFSQKREEVCLVFWYFSNKHREDFLSSFLSHITLTEGFHRYVLFLIYNYTTDFSIGLSNSQNGKGTFNEKHTEKKV